MPRLRENKHGLRVMDGETLWVGSRDRAVAEAARRFVTVVPGDTVPREDFERVDRERRALNMEADTYRQCIEDAGGLEALCDLVREHRPVHASSPPELAAWVAWCEAGCPPGRALPWANEAAGSERLTPQRVQKRTRTSIVPSAPTGAEAVFGDAAA